MTPAPSPGPPRELSLVDAPVGTPLTLRRSDGAPEFVRRLSALGLRRGAQVTVVQRTIGDGRIVAVAGARIALDRGVLGRLYVEAAA